VPYLWLWLLLRVVGSPFTWIGNAIARAYWRRQDKLAGPPLPAFLVRDSRSMLEGVMVDLGTVGRPIDGWPLVEARARPSCATPPRLLREKDWGDRKRPDAAAALASLPVRDGETRGDDDARLALPAFAMAWKKLALAVPHAILVSNGEVVVGRIVAERQDQVDHLTELVAAVARWDTGVASMLAALPEARPVYDAVYSPAVLLPGDVLVGLRDDRLLVALGARSRAVERDPARILAAVAELRAERSTGPFR
jgi:hypothetical protein